MSEVKQLSYRSFDQLLDSVRLDLSSFHLAGDVDASTLIKMAQKINFELGLKIYQPKETIVEIEHGRAKLPADFHQLELALLCHNYRQLYYPVGPGANGALQLYEQQLPPDNNNLTSCPCWHVLSTGVQTKITYCDGTVASVYYPPDTDTNVCALSIEARDGLTITTSSFCYNDPETATFTCNKPCFVCEMPKCGAIDADPFHGNRVRSLCNGDINIKIVQGCGTPGHVRCYEYFERLYIKPSRYAAAFCLNSQFKGCANEGQIKGNFIETTADCGKLYLAYLGAMEDDDGNLLVLDHPKVNLYYEYELQYTILRNLYVNGEADLERRIALVKQERDDYRDQALSIVNMPDYRSLLALARVTQELSFRRYTEPFDRYYGHIGYTYNNTGFTGYGR